MGLSEREHWFCGECGGVFPADEHLEAPHPFRPGETVTACPLCREISEPSVACDVAGCEERATSGMPTLTAYVRLCTKHLIALDRGEPIERDTP